MHTKTKTVTSHYGENRDEEMEIITFEEGGRIARVEVELGATINMGNYESLRVGVNVQLPCYHEEVELALDEAQAIADAKLAALLAECRHQRNG